MVILGIISGVLIGLGISLYLHNRVNSNYEIIKSHQRRLDALTKLVDLDSETLEILLTTHATNNKTIASMLVLMELMGGRIGFPIPGSGSSDGVQGDTGVDQD